MYAYSSTSLVAFLILLLVYARTLASSNSIRTLVLARVWGRMWDHSILFTSTC